MTDHPSTFNGDTLRSGEQAWDDRASIVTADAGAATLMRGSFAEMIRHIASMPEAERGNYVIRKAGDRVYTAAEAMALASSPGFPAQGGD
ncbi:hypothetical protein [Erythrobacter donghaensis]|uniref:hypothetical protein n=1 Tax=Erythrobacter donghaensis TaxID=267135 RepID=UPI000A3A2860|nr:hypothetical protein [Erythrobacter donghaensis]